MKAAHIRVATITLSDTRTLEDDESGRLVGELLRAGGYDVVSHCVLREEPDALREQVTNTISLDLADAIVTNGGTGISPRDRTIDTLVPMMQKVLEGFGEAFRRLSWDEIGPSAILSRATMGVIRGRMVVVLPGSPAAVRLGVEKIVVPTLAHAVALASGAAGHHHATERKGKR